MLCYGRSEDYITKCAYNSSEIETWSIYNYLHFMGVTNLITGVNIPDMVSVKIIFNVIQIQIKVSMTPCSPEEQRLKTLQ